MFFFSFFFLFLFFDVDVDDDEYKMIVSQQRLGGDLLLTLPRVRVLASWRLGGRCWAERSTKR